MAVRVDGPIRGEAATRTAVAVRSGGLCELFIPAVCRGASANISHRKARSQGGLWAPSNCMAACGSGTTGCHGWVEAHPDLARKLGLRVRRDEMPFEVRVLMRTAEWPLSWYTLDDYGTLTFAAATGPTAED